MYIPDSMNYTIYCKDREDGHRGIMIANTTSISSIHLAIFDHIWGLNRIPELVKRNV